MKTVLIILILLGNVWANTEAKMPPIPEGYTECELVNTGTMSCKDDKGFWVQCVQRNTETMARWSCR